MSIPRLYLSSSLVIHDGVNFKYVCLCIYWLFDRTHSVQLMLPSACSVDPFFMVSYVPNVSTSPRIWSTTYKWHQRCLKNKSVKEVGLGKSLSLLAPLCFQEPKINFPHLTYSSQKLVLISNSTNTHSITNNTWRSSTWKSCDLPDYPWDKQEVHSCCFAADGPANVLPQNAGFKQVPLSFPHVEQSSVGFVGCRCRSQSTTAIFHKCL